MHASSNVSHTRACSRESAGAYHRPRSGHAQPLPSVRPSVDRTGAPLYGVGENRYGVPRGAGKEGPPHAAGSCCARVPPRDRVTARPDPHARAGARRAYATPHAAYGRTRPRRHADDDGRARASVVRRGTPADVSRDGSPRIDESRRSTRYRVRDRFACRRRSEDGLGDVRVAGLADKRRRAETIIVFLFVYLFVCFFFRFRSIAFELSVKSMI